jgi:hypothetical protein
MFNRVIFLMAVVVLSIDGFVYSQDLIQISDVQTWANFNAGGFSPGDTLQIMAGGNLTVTGRSAVEDGRHLIVEEGGRLTMNARLDMDSQGIITMNGGEFHNTVDFKFPDSSGNQDVHIWLHGGLMVCAQIQSMKDRGSVLHVGGGVLRLGNAVNGDQYDPENTDAWEIVAISPYPEVTITAIGNGWKEISAGAPFKAYGPNPADGATDIVRDPVLSWIPAILAVTHDVYLGVDLDSVSNAGRNNPMNVLVAQSQETNIFSPGLLEYGQTYYWRVDEANDADPTSPWKGDVWSFTVEPYSYPIDAITATASSSLKPDFGPDRTIDGSGLNNSDGHSADMADMWLSDVEANGAWIQYTFDTIRKLDQMLVWNFNAAFESILGWGLKDITIETSENGADWTVLKSLELSQGTSEDGYTPNTIVDLEGVLAKSIKLTAHSNWGDLIDLYGLSEIRILNIIGWAREPQPLDGAEGIHPDSILNWRVGRQAALHDLYFGVDSDQLTLADTVDIHSYQLSNLDLELGRTYFWRVDEVNDVEIPMIWEGDVWRFSTADYLVVEDFESYNDIDPPNPESHRIFESWIDGFGVATNGALVGNDLPPYMERTIIHGGSQSMTMFYSNTASATYSEATRTFTDTQDWTKYGIKTLGLWFHGTAGNTGQLYVKINDTKVLYNGDAGDIAKVEWLPWTIDLTALTIDLQNVTKISIGIEGNSANGTLYIDDIQLY